MSFYRYHMLWFILKYFTANMNKWVCHYTLVENRIKDMASCVKEHNIVWNYLWLSIIANGEKDKKKKKEGRNDNLKGPISNIKFFILPVLTASAIDIITVINIISVITTVISPCKSGITQKDHMCLCSWGSLLSSI